MEQEEADGNTDQNPEIYSDSIERKLFPPFRYFVDKTTEMGSLR